MDSVNTVESSVMAVLEMVSGTTQVRANPDIALFDQHILDSFDMMQVIIALSDALHIELSPAEIEREQWATPRKIIAYLEDRIGA